VKKVLQLALSVIDGTAETSAPAESIDLMKPALE
jgi:hypothetical protein